MDASTNAQRARRSPRWLTPVAGVTLALTAVGGGAGAVAAATPAATTSLTDDTGVLTIDVPAAWTAVSTTPTTDDAGVSHAQIAAATDLDGLYKTYATPGVIYAEHDYVADTASAITTAYDFSAECTASAVTSYSDGYFTGSRLDWTGCGGTQSRVVTVLANPLDRSFSALVLVQLPTPADDAALDVVLGSFYVANPTSTALRDDTGTLAMSVPAAWTQAVTAPVDQPRRPARPRPASWRRRRPRQACRHRWRRSRRPLTPTTSTAPWPRWPRPPPAARPARPRTMPTATSPGDARTSPTAPADCGRPSSPPMPATGRT